MYRSRRPRHPLLRKSPLQGTSTFFFSTTDRTTNDRTTNDRTIIKQSLPPHTTNDRTITLHSLPPSLNLPAELILDILTHLCHFGPEYAVTALQVSPNFLSSLGRHFDYEVSCSDITKFNNIAKKTGSPLKLPHLAIDLCFRTNAPTDLQKILSEIDIEVPRVLIKDFFKTMQRWPVEMKKSISGSIKNLTCIDVMSQNQTIQNDTPWHWYRAHEPRHHRHYKLGNIYLAQKNICHTVFSACQDLWCEFDFHDDGYREYYHYHPFSFPVLQYAYIIIPRSFDVRADNIYARFANCNAFPTSVRIALIILWEGKDESNSERNLRDSTLAEIEDGKEQNHSFFGRAAVFGVHVAPGETLNTPEGKAMIQAAFADDWKKLEESRKEYGLERPREEIEDDYDELDDVYLLEALP